MEDYKRSHKGLGLNDIRTKNYQEDNGNICSTEGEWGEERGIMGITAQTKWRN